MVLTALTITLGLGSRRPGAPALVQAYAGDVLWGVLFFLLYASIWPKRATVVLGAYALVTTELIELSELYQAPWIVTLRASKLGGLLLGHVFSWSDVVCVFVGTGISAALDAYVRSRLS